MTVPHRAPVRLEEEPKITDKRGVCRGEYDRGVDASFMFPSKYVVDIVGQGLEHQNIEVEPITEPLAQHLVAPEV